MTDSIRHRSGNPRYWLLIITLAVLAHFLLVLLVKPSYFGIFKRPIDDIEASSSASSSFPHAIIAIPVDIEGDESEPVEIVEPGREDRETEARDADYQGDSADNDENILNIVNESQAPLPGIPASRVSAIPPKPVEITWPDTKNLRHCLDLRISVRIHVGAEGEILKVEPVRDDLPTDCTAAALRAASRIIFLPGKVNGNPASMWTTIQIDFREPKG